MQVIHHDSDIIAVDKPSGVPSQPDASGDAPIADMVRRYLDGKQSGGQGAVNSAIAPVHRLDRPTSGVLVLACSKRAAADLSRQFRDRAVKKEYLALVDMIAEPGCGLRLEQFLAPLPAGGMRVYRKDKPGAKQARLSLRTLARTDSLPGTALLAVDLETGVKHQIRAQLAFAGLPVIGDHRYGAFGKPARTKKIADGRAILLHAARLVVAHPGSGKLLRLEADVPGYWQPYLDAIPGAKNALDNWRRDR